MELGDMAAWAGFTIAALSFGWQVNDKLTARSAAKRALLKVEATPAQEGRVFLLWSAGDLGGHTSAHLHVRLRSPTQARLVMATVTGPTDNLRYVPFGAESRSLDLELHRTDNRLWGRVFVVGLPSVDTPFVVDVRMRDASNGKTVMNRKCWSMLGRRPAIYMEGRHQ